MKRHKKWSVLVTKNSIFQKTDGYCLEFGENLLVKLTLNRNSLTGGIAYGMPKNASNSGIRYPGISLPTIQPACGAHTLGCSESLDSLAFLCVGPLFTMVAVNINSVKQTKTATVE